MNHNTDEVKRFLENPNISKLPEDLRARCEGKITFDECEKILRSFQTGKTPGNDGIPREFYRTFWPLTGAFLVDSFNEAYDNRDVFVPKASHYHFYSKERERQELFRKLQR